MDNRLEAMVMGAFVADALALGAHWIYDTQRIDREIGRVERLMAPPPGSYHPTKQRGQFTHYGDQTLLLLESSAGSEGFEPERFARDWQAFFDGYTGYRDHATKDTLKNLSHGKPPAEAGSPSTDLGGAARIAPVILRCAGAPADQIQAARDQTALTHNHPYVIDSADFFTRVVQAVLEGSEVPDAIRQVAAVVFNRPPFAGWVADGLSSGSQETLVAIKRFGQQCEVGAAFPAVVHLVARYPMDYRSAMVENVMAGGDSAARGILAGMLLGARLGMEAIPEDWRMAMAARPRIEALLAAATAAR
jgi:ADP-ribosylglycohydrolase